MVESGTFNPDTIATRQKIADQLLLQATKQREIRSPLQGVGQLGEGLIAGIMSGLDDREQKEGVKAQAEAIASLLRGGEAGPSGAPSPQPTATPAPRPQTTLVGDNPAIPPVRMASMSPDAGIVAPPRAVVPSSSKVIGDEEGVRLGLYDPPKTPGMAPPSPVANVAGALNSPAGQPPQAGPPPAPVQVAQNAPAGTAGAPDSKAAVARMLNDPNPYVRKLGIQLGQAAVAKQLGQGPEYGKLNDESLFDKHSGKVIMAGPGFKALVDPAERAQHGIPATDNRPYQLGPGNKLINPPAETRVSIDQRAEGEYEKKSAGHFADLNHEIPKQAASARTKIASLDRLGQLLSDPSIAQGAGAGLILDAKRVAKTLGIDVGDLGGAEAVRSLQNQYALEIRNPSGGAGMPGAMSDQDRNFLASIPPGLERTVEGNKEIGGYLKKVEKRALEVERLRQDYVKRNKRLDDGFYTELADFADKTPLFPAENTQPNKGNSNSAPTIRKYNPATGKIE